MSSELLKNVEMVTDSQSSVNQISIHQSVVQDGRGEKGDKYNGRWNHFSLHQIKP